jgi:hypothetical protein
MPEKTDERVYAHGTIQLDDVGFTVLTRAEVRPDDGHGEMPICYVHFQVYKIAAGEIAGVQARAYGDNFDEPSPAWNCEATSRYAHGSVKWDGCSNWHFDVQDDCMIHFCGKSDAASIGTMMGRVYEACAEIMKPDDMEMYNGPTLG